MSKPTNKSQFDIIEDICDELALKHRTKIKLIYENLFKEIASRLHKSKIYPFQSSDNKKEDWSASAALRAAHRYIERRLMLDIMLTTCLTASKATKNMIEVKPN